MGYCSYGRWQRNGSLTVLPAQGAGWWPWRSSSSSNRGYHLTLVALILMSTNLYLGDLSFIFGSGPRFDAISSYSEAEEGGCDVFSGRWVWDEGRPLYEESECPYIPPQLTCQAHGRPDRDYLRWRWQPHGCSLPSFNVTVMLERLRGKRVMFVGDSLERGHLISLACLLQRVIPDHAKYANITYDYMTLFNAKDYNATFEFHWAPYLLASSSDDAILHTISRKQLVQKGSINKQALNWKGVDILVFNTYAWWYARPNVTMLQETHEDDPNPHVTMEVRRDEAYRIAIRSMVQWVEENMDPNNTRVFFTTMSPIHRRSIEWGGDPNGNCYNETTIIEDGNYGALGFDKELMNVLGEELRKSKYPITVLNITQLSSYRKDAHTSIYKKQWSPLTPHQLANPTSYADCTHWCLPGLQDTWNELLFAKLFYP